MKVAVFGSWRANQGSGAQAAQAGFVNACETIGREFARRGQVVIVGSEKPSTADFYVVRGMMEEARAGGAGSGLVEVLRPDDDAASYEAAAVAHPGLFTFHTRAWQKWAQTLLVTLDECDAVLTVGGAGNTLNAGLTAIVAKKPLVPLAAFGGASAELMKVLEARGMVSGIPEFRQLNGPWTGASVRTVLRLLGVKDEQANAPRPLPRVFIGSSTEGLKVAREIQSQLTGDAACVVWNQGTVFGLGTAYIEALEKALGDYDFSIFVFTPDDLLTVRGQSMSAPRDNVVFELGLFIGRHSRARSFIVRPAGLHLPTDLNGVQTADYDPGNPLHPSVIGPVCHSIRRAIESAAG